MVKQKFYYVKKRDKEKLFNISLLIIIFNFTETTYIYIVDQFEEDCFKCFVIIAGTFIFYEQNCHHPTDSHLHRLLFKHGFKCKNTQMLNCQRSKHYSGHRQHTDRHFVCFYQQTVFPTLHVYYRSPIPIPVILFSWASLGTPITLTFDMKELTTT